MTSSSGVDVLVVALESTPGWRAAGRELIQSLERVGARVATVGTGQTPRVRTFALTDLVEARAARRACLRGIAQHEPKAVIYCSITASLLWPRPGAIWLDSTATENRPGRHGIWQRPVERRRLVQAPIVLAMSPGALGPLEHRRHPDAVVPVPVEPSPGTPPPRDIDAITYAGDPEKRRLDHVLATWDQARHEGETLVVAGHEGIAPRSGVDLAGRLDPAEYRTLLRRARVFIAAPRREDYGIAPLEALVDGCLLVTTPAPGAYPAREIASQLDPRLVDDDLARAIRTALDDPPPGYALKAAELLKPFTRRAVDQTVAERVLPRLLSG
jgi:glycosyl transferase family 1